MVSTVLDKKYLQINEASRRELDDSVNVIIQKNFEILKFVDFHFKFVDFACRNSTVKCSF